MSGEVNPHFWAGKKVFLTGHTGFKGGWLSIWLSMMGAKVVGFSLEPNTDPSLFDVAKISSVLEASHIGNICDLELLQSALAQTSPDIVIHMAAQPLVRYSYANPVETFATNVMGSVNILESIRKCKTVKAVVIVTTDKCYDNKEWVWGYREDEAMGGHDPYSSSKGCAELVTAAYRQSFFSENNYSEHLVAIASARAGNVIGGGDWSQDRLIPDAIVAFEAHQKLNIRNPMATRPWQHVLEPLSGYLVLAQALYDRGTFASGAWNFGPNEGDARSVKDLIELLISKWKTPAAWVQDGQTHPHEANFLKLDCSKARQILRWQPKWSLEIALDAIVQWNEAFKAGDDMLNVTKNQIKSYASH